MGRFGDDPVEASASGGFTSRVGIGSRISSSGHLRVRSARGSELPGRFRFFGTLLGYTMLTGFWNNSSGAVLFGSPDAGSQAPDPGLGAGGLDRAERALSAVGSDPMSLADAPVSWACGPPVAGPAPDLWRWRKESESARTCRGPGNRPCDGAEERDSCVGLGFVGGGRRG